MALNALRWSEFMWHRVLQGHSGVQWIQAIELAAWKDAGGIVWRSRRTRTPTSTSVSVTCFARLLCRAIVPTWDSLYALAQLPQHRYHTRILPSHAIFATGNIAVMNSNHAEIIFWIRIHWLSLRSSSSLAIPIANSRNWHLSPFPAHSWYPGLKWISECHV